ncbi:hypothetical protein HHL23_21790 [Chryseobacterium sp. RP-3-3]|uniref:Uncharacterized protein n=1 Tax=Chryseobacterium antibioticum TaxID=2728847 RepID=A0A7Y0AS55_9FLAO|nr:hypothetical protein [Chryseobacterium antibioticum]
MYSAIFASLLATGLSAQVSIGGKTSVEGSSSILDFNSDTQGIKVVTTAVAPNNKNTEGIILPAFSLAQAITDGLTTAGGSSNGTFYFDTQEKVVKMLENGVWVSLSDAATGSTTAITPNTSAESTQRQGAIIKTSNGTSLSATEIATIPAGVLVLESPNKALILPRIESAHLLVKSPYPGMMCYDVLGKALAIFDGTVWNYWK